MSCLAILLALLTLAPVAMAAPDHPYVGYNFFERRRTGSDCRECATQIFLTADDYVGYRYRENVAGAITLTVRAVAFSNAYRRKATPEEQAELVRALLAAGVFDLADESKTAASDYSGYLHVQIDSREAEVTLHSPPDAPLRKAVHAVLLDFAHRMKIDEPVDIAAATTLTEGDRQPARTVSLAEVLAHPETYQGKRVSVVGFYHGEFEGHNLAVDRRASDERVYQRSVWRGGVSTFADPAAIQYRNDAWLRIEGVFLRGPSGHRGLWPGKLERITSIEPVAPPE